MITDKKKIIAEFFFTKSGLLLNSFLICFVNLILSWYITYQLKLFYSFCYIVFFKFYFSQNMTRVCVRKVHVLEPGLEGKYHVCPKARCGFKSLYKQSYKYHFQAQHMPHVFSWICDCGAGLKRKHECSKHEYHCEGSKEANDKGTTKTLRQCTRNIIHVQPAADDDQILDQIEEMYRLNQLVIDMQDRLDSCTRLQPQIPCMSHLQVRLVNVWNAPYEVNVNNESSDN